MKRFAGLDGYRKGWVVVWIAGAERDFALLGNIAQLFETPFERAAIDIPIGLPDSGDRGCDVEARALLAPHRARVFTGVRRWLFDFADYPAINAEAVRRGEKKISKQLHAIMPKIREVDAVLSPARQARLLESHPELVFRRLNGGVPLIRKHDAEGLEQRRALLHADGFHDLDKWRLRLRRTGAKADDLFDACACAIAARDGTGRVPAHPREDARGLRMQINY